MVGLLLLVSCGAGPAGALASRADSNSRLYEADATVLQNGMKPPRLCLGTVLDSLPPQCGDVPIIGWNWDAVPGEERSGDTTWGDYHVEGTYDGSSFMISSVGARLPADPGESGPFSTLCPEPVGGWVWPESGMTSDQDLVRAQSMAEDHVDFAGDWIDYLAAQPDPVDPRPYVFNVAFIGDLGSHKMELRSLWGGPLCVTHFDRTSRELRQIQDSLSVDKAQEFGLHLLWTDTNVVRNQVEIGVVTTSPAINSALEAAYGVGAVSVIPTLRLVA